MSIIFTRGPRQLLVFIISVMLIMKHSSVTFGLRVPTRILQSRNRRIAHYDASNFPILVCMWGIVYYLMITFDIIVAVITVANCHFTMYYIKCVLLDYIKASYSVFNMLMGSRGDLGSIMVQALVMMFRTVVKRDCSGRLSW